MPMGTPVMEAVHRQADGGPAPSGHGYRQLISERRLAGGGYAVNGDSKWGAGR